MTATLNMQALCVGENVDSLQKFAELLSELKIEVEFCRTPAAAGALLRSAKFDAIIVDCPTLVETRETIESVRGSRSSSKAVIFVLTRGVAAAQQLLRTAAHFVLEHPIDRERIVRSLRAAYGLMLQERRRYYRHPVDIAARLVCDSEPPKEIRILNISEGGVAVDASSSLLIGNKVTIQFQLPDLVARIKARGTVLWADQTGRAGIGFNDVDARDHRLLRSWVTEVFNEKFAFPVDGCRPDPHSP